MLSFKLHVHHSNVFLNNHFVQVHPSVKLRRIAKPGKRIVHTMGRALSAGKAFGGIVGRSVSPANPAVPGQAEFDTRSSPLTSDNLQLYALIKDTILS